MVPEPKDLLTRGSRLRWELGGLGARLGPPEHEAEPGPSVSRSLEAEKQA